MHSLCAVPISGMELVWAQASSCLGWDSGRNGAAHKLVLRVGWGSLQVLISLGVGLTLLVTILPLSKKFHLCIKRIP